ncbi:MAG: DUF2141 domain-containing protein [Flavobacteriaceae bacterium]|nr:DUF2141 domain-containing protein [Flavobacteriaceae bacterium]
MIKNILTLAVLLGFALPSQLSAQNTQVEVSITGISSGEGKMMIAIYNSEETFLKKHIAARVSEIENGTVTVVFDKLEAGTYAISCFQDKNNNGVLDFNFMGIPKEPTGCSNNTRGFMGPPKYLKAKIYLKEGNNTHSIKM